MNESEWRELFALADKRNEKLWAWLRYLVGLGGGTLAVLVSLGSDNTGIADICMRGAQVSIGLGILLGASALYAEIWQAHALVRRFLELNSIRACSGQPDERLGPVVAKPSKIFHWCERLCYVSLATAVAFLIGFALTH